MDVKAERVNPYHGDTRRKTEQVRDMFDSIAPAYDFMNRMMTFGIHMPTFLMWPPAQATLPCYLATGSIRAQSPVLTLAKGCWR